MVSPGLPTTACTRPGEQDQVTCLLLSLLLATALGSERVNKKRLTFGCHFGYTARFELTSVGNITCDACLLARKNYAVHHGTANMKLKQNWPTTPIWSERAEAGSQDKHCHQAIKTRLGSTHNEKQLMWVCTAAAGATFCHATSEKYSRPEPCAAM